MPTEAAISAILDVVQRKSKQASEIRRQEQILGYCLSNYFFFKEA